MAKWRSIIKKLHAYFFRKSEEEPSSPQEIDFYHNKKVAGRIINDDTSQHDFVHQYPKTGKFRFPLDVDNDYLQQSTVRSEKRTNVRLSTEKRKRAEESRTKFSNRNFQVRRIPSPVYGFHERKRETEQLLTEPTALALNKEVIEQQESVHEEMLQHEAINEHTPKLTVVKPEQREEKVVPLRNVTKEHSRPNVTAVQLSRHMEEKQEPIKNGHEETPKKRYEREERERNVMPSPTVQSERVHSNYQFPPISLLKKPMIEEEDDSDFLFEQADRLEETLQNFNVSATVVDVTKGPAVTRYELQPAPGVKVSKITSLTDDIKLALAAKDIRMEAPIPGKHAIGIEVPNLKSLPVFLYEIISHRKFRESTSPLTVALGLDISGEPIVTDLKKMPHGLVAGATGSGKSVCINSIIVSLLYKATPDEVKLMLIDPKVVELAPYNELPHLITPVITDAKQATAALKWAVAEMERRYELFSQKGVRDIGRYNEVCQKENPSEKLALPYIVIIIDELADLMMVSPQDVEDAICRIAQKARACGIHLLLATQRPSVDVITGLIKANIPTRIAFSVSSQVDSRTIIDMSGAERLLGKGDMLFHENGSPQPIRVQGTFVSDEEIEDVIDFVKQQQKPNYEIETEQLVRSQEGMEQDDELFTEACYFVIEQGGASASLLQRRFRIGYNRAARLIDMMEASGIVSEALGSKPRNILMSVQQFEETILQMNQQ